MGEAANPLLLEGFQAGCHVVLRGRRGTLWHSNLFDNVSKMSRMEDVSREMLVFLHPCVSSRVSGFPVASPCLWGKLQNISFSKVSKEVVMLFCVATVARCRIPTCLNNVSKVSNLAEVSHEMLVLLLPRVSSRVSGFPVASPCLWGKLQILSFSKVSKQVVMSFCVAGVALCDIPTCLITRRKCQEWRTSRAKCSFFCTHVSRLESLVFLWSRRVYGGSCKTSPFFFEGFQAGCPFVLRGRHGTLWHSNLFDNASKMSKLEEVSHEMLVFSAPACLVSSLVFLWPRRVYGGSCKTSPFSKVSKQVVMSFCVAGVVLCDIPTCCIPRRKFFCVAGATMHSTLYTPHSTLHTPPHATLYTLHTPHSALYTPRSSLYTPHSTLHTPHTTPHTLTLYIPHSTIYTLDSSLHTQHFTLHTLHSTLYTFYFPPHTPHSTLYTPHSTLYIPHSSTLYTHHTPHSTLYTPHSFLYTPHSTVHAPHSTLYTLHFTLYTPHSTLYTLHTLHW